MTKSELILLQRDMFFARSQYNQSLAIVFAINGHGLDAANEMRVSLEQIRHADECTENVLKEESDADN